MAESSRTLNNAAQAWVPSQFSPNQVAGIRFPASNQSVARTPQNSLPKPQGRRSIDPSAAGYGWMNPVPTMMPPVRASRSGSTYGAVLSGNQPYVAASPCFIDGVGPQPQPQPYGYGYQYPRQAQRQLNCEPINGAVGPCFVTGVGPRPHGCQYPKPANGVAGPCFVNGVRPRPYCYGCQYPRPVQLQANEFVESRARMVQSHQNPALPYQPNVFGLVRCGTGVFHPPRSCSHPRVTTIGEGPSTTTKDKPVVTTTKDKPLRKRSGRTRKKQGAEVTPQSERSRDSSKGDDGLGKLEECCSQHSLSSELGLPNEWTYGY